MQPLASKLLGKTVGQWEVVEMRKKTPEDNSGFFSTCYLVKNSTGEMAFLKAYNYQYALAIDSGEYREPAELIPVPYLVFEIAQGSLKTHAINNPELAWKLKAFHGALVGLAQLHRAKIAHQDIKPSNILMFGNNLSKISDLGSATQLNNESNWATDGHCGDMRYAPIELLYGYFSPNWDTRRFGADLFMMGGLLTYMIADSNFLSLLHQKLPENQKFHNFGGTFDQAKRFLVKAYCETLEEIKPEIPKVIREGTLKVIAELSHPVPEERGNPKKLQNRHRQYSLQRYISVMDRLAKTLMWTRNGT